MGPSPLQVQNAFLDEIQETNSKVLYGRGEKVRKTIADYIKCGKEEVSITHNTTEGINVAVWGLPLKKKDEVIIKRMEYLYPKAQFLLSES